MVNCFRNFCQVCLKVIFILDDEHFKCLLRFIFGFMATYKKLDFMKISSTAYFTVFTQFLGSFSIHLENYLE